MKTFFLVVLMAMGSVCAPFAQADQHEIRGNMGALAVGFFGTGVETASMSVTFGQDLTTFGFGVGYGYRLSDLLQLTANGSLSVLSVSGRPSTTIWSILPGVRFNFGSESFHDTAWVGVNLGVSGVSAGSGDTSFMTTIDLGKRFAIAGNVSYAPFFLVAIAEMEDVRFGIVPVAFNFTF